MRRLARARKAPRDLVLRARMVELSWSGQRVPAIADELRCRRGQTVKQVLDGVVDRPAGDDGVVSGGGPDVEDVGLLQLR